MGKRTTFLIVLNAVLLFAGSAFLPNRGTLLCAAPQASISGVLGPPAGVQPPANISPDEMAAICNKRAVLTGQYDSLRSAVDSDYSAMRWTQTFFQTKVDQFNWWANFTQNYNSFKEARDSVSDALKPGLFAIEAVKEGPVLAILKQDIEWTTFNVMDAATGQVSKARLQALEQMTEDQLKQLKTQQDQMKKDIQALKDVSAQLQPLPACDTTKLIPKEPQQPVSPSQNATVVGTPQTPPAAPPAQQVVSTPSGNHTGLVLLVGGLGAAGAVAYAAGVAMKNQANSSGGGTSSGHCVATAPANACGACTCSGDCGSSSQCGGDDCWTSGSTPPFC